MALAALIVAAVFCLAVLTAPAALAEPVRVKVRSRR